MLVGGAVAETLCSQPVRKLVLRHMEPKTVTSFPYRLQAGLASSLDSD